MFVYEKAVPGAPGYNGACLHNVRLSAGQLVLVSSAVDARIAFDHFHLCYVSAGKCQSLCVFAGRFEFSSVRSCLLFHDVVYLCRLCGSVLLPPADRDIFQLAAQYQRFGNTDTLAVAEGACSAGWCDAPFLDCTLPGVLGSWFEIPDLG